MARGMGYGASHGSMARKAGKHAAITRKKRVRPLKATRKRAGNVKKTSRYK